MKKIAYIIVLSFIVSACSDNKSSKSLLPNSTGRAGDLVIVIDKGLWESSLGDTLKYTLSQSQVALPQPEPIFTLINIPSDAFGNTFKLSRNILVINISSDFTKPQLTFDQDKWAKFQMVLYLNAPDEETMIQFFGQHKNKIISKILESERERVMKVNKRHEEHKIREILEREHKISLVFPAGYKLDVDSTYFLWISRAEPDVDQGILIYYYPYLDESDLLKENLIKKRNEILKKYVHGSNQGSYMTTEDLVPVYYNSFYRENKLYIAEMRGLWKLEKGFMGGPFVSHTTIDTLYSRIVTIDGYVFAPNKDKRNLIRQVEAILASLQITK